MRFISTSIVGAVTRNMTLGNGEGQCARSAPSELPEDDGNGSQ
jgi:hypothetical protein